jgi:hypothetical protein
MYSGTGMASEVLFALLYAGIRMMSMGNGNGPMANRQIGKIGNGHIAAHRRPPTHIAGPQARLSQIKAKTTCNAQSLDV